MKKSTVFIVLLLAVNFMSCMTEKHNFPIDKEYWDVNDYDKAIFDLRFTYEDNETKPTFDNPEQSVILEKLTNPDNYKVLLDNNDLDLNQKSKIAADFISQWNEMNKIYAITDTSDKFLYGKEMLVIWQFGLGLQLAAFDIEFDQVVAKSKDPLSEEVEENIEPSVKKLIRNYANYLSLAAKENSFYEKEKEDYAKGLDKYFKQLIQVYPDANYDRLLKKATSILEVAKSSTIKTPLKNLIALINTQKNKEEQA
ncbi:hypothetical protein [uncultured Tenacibaculum sp.]|uniref:hypothetical protein n=1 Tax=uncultured Tenacibaculum sp. TaxID=174713 RepID=UPI002609C955|nr:hypothetical protein [uncultured Tenacibaculum sp.]